MSDDGCNNGCTIPPAFPRRPGENPPTPHSEGCFCCSPNARVSVDNRPALSHFNYRIGTYGTIREWLFDRINQTPELQSWTHRAPDDPAVALLEGAAILGDILSFYQDTYANEAYLRTARWRENIGELVRLLGYRLSPALGGNATFAFELKKDEPVTVPAGFPLKATMETSGKPADFETTEEITAYPWLSRFNLYRPLDTPDITPQTTEFYISMPSQLTSPVEIKVGEKLILGESDKAGQPKELKNAEIVTIDSVRELHGEKIYKIKGRLKRKTNIEYLTAYRIGRTFRHFGKNNLDGTGGGGSSTTAPTSATMIDTSQPVTSKAVVTSTETTTTSTIPKVYVPLVKSLAEVLSDGTVSQYMSHLEIPLDTDVPDLTPNMPMIFEFGVLNSFRETYLPHISLVRTIEDVRSTAMTWGVDSGTVSIVTISESLNSSITDPNTGQENLSWMFISDAQFHEVTSPLLGIRRVKKEVTALKGNTVLFYGTAAEAETLEGRRLMFEKTGQEPTIDSVASVNVNPGEGTEDIPQLYTITMSGELKYADFPNEEPKVTVYGNLADADEGKTLPEEVLGSGDATLVFQNFKIPKAPLTYHITPENSPPETPEIAIYVDGRLWLPVDTFFGRGPEEHIYIVREDAEGSSWVQFGDGKTGARLTTGVKNVTAMFRTGSGAFGPLKIDTKVQASAKLKNLDKVQMPMDASGGSAPEDGDNARQSAPGKVQSLGRIVSLKDFEAEATAVPGVASALAAWGLIDNIPSVVITVLMETGRSTEIDAVSDAMDSYNDTRGAGRNPVVVMPGKRMYVKISVQYGLNPEFRADLVEPEIRRALGVNYGLATLDEDQTGLFSLRRRRFGAREYASSIEGHVQNVEGVVWAKTTAFKALSDSDDPASIALPLSNTLNPIVACDMGHILSLYDKHLIIDNSSAGGGA